MIYVHRIDVSEGIDVNKTSGSKVCDLSLLLSFIWRFNFQPDVCNDVMIY